MKIGIIGDGDVAQSLGRGLLELGHHVMIGSHAATGHGLVEWAKQHRHKHGTTGTTTEAASFGEIAFLAAPWHASEDILAQIRPELAGKIVIDITNPLLFEETGPPSLVYGHNMSGGELIQQSLPDSHVVKTLNFISYRHMIQPKYHDGKPAMFVCGNNPAAKKYVAELLHELGWVDVTDIGKIHKARLLEPLCALWIEYGLAHENWDHAFAILKK